MHDTVVGVLEGARQSFTRLKGVVEQAPVDAVTAHVAMFLDALQEGLTGEESGDSTGGGIAAQLLRMATVGEQTELTIALGTVRLLALEWDIDPLSAARLFELS
jgi:hypothetical protein